MVIREDPVKATAFAIWEWVSLVSLGYAEELSHIFSADLKTRKALFIMRKDNQKLP